MSQSNNNPQARGADHSFSWSARLRSSRLLRFAAITFLATLALAQDGDVAQIGSSEVLRVGAHIACQCGSCKDTVACPMALQGCGFCNPARVRIAKLQLAGMKDNQIIDVFKKEYGAGIYRADPNSFFWVIPYGALAMGLLAIVFFLRQSFRPKATPSDTAAPGTQAPGTPIDPRYLAAAEKETSSLDQ
jgi:hypothetical protein